MTAKTTAPARCSYCKRLAKRNAVGWCHECERFQRASEGQWGLNEVREDLEGEPEHLLCVSCHDETWCCGIWVHRDKGDDPANGINELSCEEVEHCAAAHHSHYPGTCPDYPGQYYARADAPTASWSLAVKPTGSFPRGALIVEAWVAKRQRDGTYYHTRPAQWTVDADYPGLWCEAEVVAYLSDRILGKVPV